ncbi:MAG TPA: alpha/beta hydrolase [Rhizobacter sp.]|nr:alpha/beta hydrolase [Rhizobacter sp.]
MKLLTLLHRLAFALALSATLAGCSAGLNKLTPSSTYVLTEGVAYGPLPRQKLDVYRPTVAAPPGGWPVAVFFYGGSWNWGDRAEYRFVGEALASRGVLTLVADYRLYPEVRYPSFLEDSAQAVAYGLREAGRLGGNPKRVFAVGHSAGAYNAAMLALDDRWLSGTGQSPAALAGWVGLAGPYEFLPISNPNAQPVFNHPNYPPGTQPIAYANHSARPVFLGAARDDNLVDPQRNTAAMATRLQAAGAPVALKLYDGVNHVTLVASMAWSLRWMSSVLDDVSAFITQTGATPATPAPPR